MNHANPFLDSLGIPGRPGLRLVGKSSPLTQRPDSFRAKDVVSRDWLSGFRPGDKAQTMGSCVGRGSANLAEILIQYAQPGALLPGQQLDGDRLYLWIRREYYRDADPDGGALIEEGVRALTQCGILPPDTPIYQVDPLQEYLDTALERGPILQGHLVDSAWSSPDPETGIISDVLTDILGGHCTVLGGQWFYPDRDALYPAFNSWGDAWARHGVGFMSWSRWLRTWVDTWQILPTSNLGTWTGWREWLIPQWSPHVLD